MPRPDGTCGKPVRKRTPVASKSTSILDDLRKLKRARQVNESIAQGISTTQRVGIAIALLAVVGTVAPTFVRFIRNAALGKPKASSDDPDPGILSELASKLGSIVATPVRGALALGGVALASGLVYVAISQIWPRIPSYKKAFECIRYNPVKGRSASDSATAKANQWKQDAMKSLHLVKLAFEFDENRTTDTKELKVSYKPRRSGKSQLIGIRSANVLRCVGEPAGKSDQTKGTSLEFLCEVYKSHRNLSPVLWKLKY